MTAWNQWPFHTKQWHVSCMQQAHGLTVRVTTGATLDCRSRWSYRPCPLLSCQTRVNLKHADQTRAAVPNRLRQVNRPCRRHAGGNCVPGTRCASRRRMYQCPRVLCSRASWHTAQGPNRQVMRNSFSCSTMPYFFLTADLHVPGGTAGAQGTYGIRRENTCKTPMWH